MYKLMLLSFLFSANNVFAASAVCKLVSSVNGSASTTQILSLDVSGSGNCSSVPASNAGSSVFLNGTAVQFSFDYSTTCNGKPGMFAMLNLFDKRGDFYTRSAGAPADNKALTGLVQTSAGKLLYVINCSNQ